ncbi:MAG: OmpH family outer membrane protein [Muribaculaceae bacterium]|nr:OmpH family outer membrane protein [Muribaculaceae bacterium]
MIKKLLLIAALALPMLLSAQTFKVGLVDMNDIFEKLPETTAAQNSLAETNKKYEAEMQRIDEELQRQYEELQKMDENEPAAIKERKARQVQETQQKREAFYQSAMQDLQKQQQELTAPIFQKIQSAIESVGKENGFSLIQELQSVQFFAAPVEDITPLVKAKLGL